MSQKKNPPKKRNKNAYLKYTGMAFQMLTPLLVGAYAGYHLDSYLNTSPLFMVVLLFGAVIMAMYVIIREFM